ncbi:Sigma-70 family RNA polymerase sigma factor, partial [Dysosmobacter welbionis]
SYPSPDGSSYLHLLQRSLQRPHIALDDLGLAGELVLEGALHILDELLLPDDAGHPHDGGQHGGVGEVLAQLLLADLTGVDGADPALVALQQGPQLRGGLAGVDDDGAFLLQSGGHVHGGQQGLIHDHHIVREVDVGMDGAPLGADPVVGGDGRAHALGTVLREALDILARVERRVRQQQRRRFGALA